MLIILVLSTARNMSCINILVMVLQVDRYRSISCMEGEAGWDLVDISCIGIGVLVIQFVVLWNCQLLS